MKTFLQLLSLGVLALGSASAEPQIPAPLEPWKDWATWDAAHRDCPTPWNDSEKHLCFWPGALAIAADQKAATWKLEVTVFGETWLPLPGGPDTWPLEVLANGSPIPVVARDGQPSVQLGAGRHTISGTLRWEEMPQRVKIPDEIGIVTLQLEGAPIESPNRDHAGHLWLKRVRMEATDQDAVTAAVYRVLEDGIPLRLHTEIELSVSGKSREEELGQALPAGWLVSSVDSQIPVALDDQGRMKAQVRAGKWTIRVDAFRTTDLEVFDFAEGTEPIVDSELIGFQSRPEFRMADIEGIQPVDVSQTTFPDQWRSLPVYLWKTDTSFRLVEKMRGMGLQQPEGLKIERQFWLDETGRSLTFRDTIQGERQQIWRLDVAAGHDLGAVRIGGQPQLITESPETGAHGVEIRTRNLDLQALGRIESAGRIPATGWRAPADALTASLNLPPGWRLFALFGADWVDGDWLTAWSLLDLFLLLIFSLAVFRLWGVPAGLVAFLAFGLCYHEPDAPRYAWFLLLIPVALLRVVPEGGARKWVNAWKYAAAALLILLLVPFVARQIQSALYPQLEQAGVIFTAARAGRSETYGVASEASRSWLPSSPPVPAAEKAKLESANLLYEAQARIQTGPAEPEWSWNTVRFGWNGPVSAEETIRPILISLPVHRLLTAIRILFTLWLGYILLGARKLPKRPPATTTAALLLAALFPLSASAEIPNDEMLDTLRARLLKPADAFPNAAEIPTTILSLTDGRIRMEAGIHAATEVAVPLPGRLPSWSPLTVTLDGKPAAALRRQDGFLWLVVPRGVHRVVVTGALPDVTEWEWTFLLRPRRVEIDAPGWTVTGLRPDGIPENQIFFVRQREATAGEAAYDRKDFNVLVAVDRHVEIGLRWQVRNEITRLSASEKAVALRIPLLAGEKVLSSGAIVKDGFVEVRLGAAEKSFSWQSELPVTDQIVLEAPETDRWIERWHLVTSPVWNVSLSGLPPVFEQQEQSLVPVWHPWPGERAALSFSKPKTVPGETMTVRRVRHEISLGSRQRTGRLQLTVECSLGDDFLVDLDPDAEISSLKRDDRTIPVRRAEGKVIVPVQPGSQTIDLEWRTSESLRAHAAVGPVTLPVDAANVTTVLGVPESRWVLWADGPLRGPAVRFWTVLVFALLAAWVLGGLPLSPLRRVEWVLLSIGLTQIHYLGGLLVVGWLFLLAWRGKQDRSALGGWRLNLLQIALVLLSAAALGVLVGVVSAGLLGDPEMFIRGNDSSRTSLQWFEPRSDATLPQPWVLSVSVWFYRLLMLAWALWLAAALIRWLKWGWVQFSAGGCWERRGKTKQPPPPLPPAEA